MNVDLVRSLFDSARERLETTGRWGGLAVLVLLVLYVATFQPFLEARQALQTTRDLEQELRQHRSDLVALGRDIAEFRKAVDRRIHAAVDDLLQAKVKDFQALGQRVTALQKGESGAPAETPQRPMVQAEPVQDTGVDPSRVPPLPEAMARQVREASSSLSELRQILRPYIESQIIQPRFDAINERLREQVAPELRQRLDELRTQAQEVRERLQGVDEQLARQPAVADRGAVAKSEEKDWATLWEALHGALDRSEQALQSLSLEPPRGDPDWWYSVAAKLRTLEELGEQAVEDLRTQEVNAVADELTGRLDQALEQQGALEDEMKRTLATLEKQFDRQQEQMQTLGTPFQWISLDLETSAGRLPLLLAVVLSALSLARSQRLRQLGLALALLPERKALWVWYRRHGFGLPRNVEGGPGLLMAGLGELAGTLGWVGLAFYQTAAEASVATLLAAFGLPLVAYAYRQWVVREMWWDVMETDGARAE